MKEAHSLLRASRLGAVFLALVLATVAAMPQARANRGLLYGPEDSVPFGPPNPDGLVGYCIPWSFLTAMHMGFGATVLNSDEPSHRYYMDLTAGVRCGRSLNADPGYSGYVFMPQLGYTFEAGASNDYASVGRAHLGRVGVGVGIGSSRATLLYVPRFLFGHRDGISARGMRHGLVASFGSDLFTIEASHQVLVVGGRPEHDLRLGLSVNLAIVAYVLAH